MLEPRFPAWLPGHIGLLPESLESRQFHVAHFCWCGTLCNKGTFEPDLQVKSVYVPAVKAYCCGWAYEAVLSTVRFRRVPRNSEVQLHSYVIALPPKTVILSRATSASQAGDEKRASCSNMTVPSEKLQKRQVLMPPGPLLLWRPGVFQVRAFSAHDAIRCLPPREQDGHFFWEGADEKSKWLCTYSRGLTLSSRKV